MGNLIPHISVVSTPMETMIYLEESVTKNEELSESV